MNFFVQKNGRTLGPFLVFQVREMVEDGELSAGDIGWHEGLEKWLPLGEIPALDAVWKKLDAPGTEAAAEAPESAPSAEAVEPAPSRRRAALPDEMPFSLPASPVLRANSQRAWTRWVARIFDTVLFLMIIVGVVVSAGVSDLGILMRLPPFLAFGPGVAWIFLETLCLAHWGATPGKALMGLKVETQEGERLSYGQALARSSSVWFFGSGADLPFFKYPLWLFAYLRMRITGDTSWDARLHLRVLYRPVPTFGIVACVLLFAGWVFMLGVAMTKDNSGGFFQWMNAPEKSNPPTQPAPTSPSPAQPAPVAATPSQA